ncbi:hypothetical protein Tco_0497727 [Tanacetum coccineum]
MEEASLLITRNKTLITLLHNTTTDKHGRPPQSACLRVAMLDPPSNLWSIMGKRLENPGTDLGFVRPLQRSASKKTMTISLLNLGPEFWDKLDMPYGKDMG